MRRKRLKLKVVITNNNDGTITINSDGFSKTVWIRAKTGEQKFESVRTAILEEGLVFSEKIEKMVRRELNL